MINELMAGRVKEGEISEIYNVFRKPNWQEVVKEIAKQTCLQKTFSKRKRTFR